MNSMIPYRRPGLSARSIFPDLFPGDRFFRSFFDMNDWMGSVGFRVDIREKNNAYVLEAELPGVQESDITLTAENDELTISADIGFHEADEQALYSERRAGHISRSFHLEGIDEENISASYQNGVLYVMLPKHAPAQEENKQRRIPISSGKQEKT